MKWKSVAIILLSVPSCSSKHSDVQKVVFVDSFFSLVTAMRRMRSGLKIESGLVTHSWLRGAHAIFGAKAPVLVSPLWMVTKEDSGTFCQWSANSSNGSETRTTASSGKVS